MAEVMVASYMLRVTGYGLRVTSCKLQVTSYKLHVMSMYLMPDAVDARSPQPAACSLWPVASSPSPVACRRIPDTGYRIPDICPLPEKGINCGKHFAMETKRYSLETRETNKFVRYAQIVFGVVCLITAGWWSVYLTQSDSGGDYWIATLFLLGFGLFQIYSGLGYAARYVEISDRQIIIKQASIGTPDLLPVSDIAAIEILPLSVNFKLRSGKKKTLRFGIAYTDYIDDIKDAVAQLAENRNILIEEKNEKL